MTDHALSPTAVGRFVIGDPKLGVRNKIAVGRGVVLTLGEGTVAEVPGEPGQEQTVHGVFRSTDHVGYLKEASMSTTHPAFPTHLTELVSGGAK